MSCTECYLKGCDCECDTCVAARERNEKLSSSALLILQLADIMKVDVTKVEEHPSDFTVLKKMLEGR